jgi:sugar lactone lactonase YvrE
VILNDAAMPGIIDNAISPLRESMSMFTPELKVVHDRPMQLGESPLWHPEEQRLYWIDIEGRAVHCLDPSSGAHRSWNMPSEPGCIAWCHGGGMLVALRSGLNLLDTDTGKLKPVMPPPYDPARVRFNDGGCDAAGRLWIGTIYEPRDQPNAVLYCLEKGVLRDSGARATVSNGLAFSPDNHILYHADTTAHRITAYDFDLANGTLGAGRLLRQFSVERSASYGGRPDGAAVDSAGNYWCAMYEGSRLLQLSSSGETLQEIPLPLRCPTMVAFGGTDLRTLYITTVRANRSAQELEACPLSGFMLSLRVETPGQRAYAYLP